MTQIRSTLLTILAASAMLLSCKPESVKDYEPVTTGGVESIAGTWTGTSVLQRDRDAERKNFPYKTQDITNLLEFNKVKLTLVANGGQPTTFTVDHGTAPQIFRLTSGTWKVDNTEKVGTISLINAGDTIKLTLGSYSLLASNKMLLKQSKTLLGVEVINYEFNFSK
ncbi:MAG TPA: hypothetical protein VD993_14075 [Chitinophagaceae bacterium]|nr:hypothetical protein [Chitinophagaceae bacterium]